MIGSETTAVIVFVLAYAGIALGGVPGLALDRTGVALLGAIAMVVGKVLTTREAVLSIDTATILLLYALMIISAQFRLSGFYTAVALRLTRRVQRPAWFLAAVMLSSAGLSAILANDIVCLAFTPVLCLAVLQSRRDPLPYLLGLAAASNIGSAATIIGNPQNMLLGQLGHLPFGRFTLFALPPVLLSLAAAYGVIWLLYRRHWHDEYTVPCQERRRNWPAFNPWQVGKGVAVTALLIALFFTPIPRELTAMGLAGVLLCSRRMHTRDILGLVDWHLITLFCALFIIIAGISATGLPAYLLDHLQQGGFALLDPLNLTVVTTVLSNLVSNVPATMLLVKFLPAGAPLPWFITALVSTFAGNLITIGSIANLIVIEGAREYGVVIGFRRHARAGIPITLLSLAVTLLWLAVR